MPEPTSSAATGVAVAIGTVTLTGSFLGLQYDLLLAGIFGGCVALSFLRPASFARMVITLITSALVAGFGAPVLMAWVSQFTWALSVLPAQMKLFCAFVIGICSQTLVPLLLEQLRERIGVSKNSVEPPK